ncbi:MAG: hypothetical protein ACRC6U_10030 [Fusobacteriaceae bacterium]
MNCKTKKEKLAQKKYDKKAIEKKKVLGTYNYKNETAEERETRLEKARFNSKKRRAEETPEQRTARLKKAKEARDLAASKETPEQRAERLEKYRLMRLQRIANETPEQKEKRLEGLKEAVKRFRENNPGIQNEYNKRWLSTEEKKEKKRIKDREYKKKNREKLNAQSTIYYRKKSLDKKIKNEEEKEILFELMRKIKIGANLEEFFDKTFVEERRV